MSAISLSTGYWSTKVGYKELVGSGEQEYSQDANTSKRSFLVEWRNADRFAAELIGNTQIVGGGSQKRTPPKRDPDRNGLVCKKCTVAGDRLGEHNGKGYIAYEYARISADFSTPDRPDANDGEDNDSVTYLSESYEPLVELIPLEGWDLLWQGGSQEGEPVGEDAVFNYTLRKIKVTINVERWYNPPLLDMFQAAGQCNNAIFRPTILAYPAESLLFSFPGASYELTSKTKSLAQTPWSLGLEFIYHPFGWNTLFNPKDLDWVDVATAGGRAPVQTYDFGRLLPGRVV